MLRPSLILLAFINLIFTNLANAAAPVCSDLFLESMATTAKITLTELRDGAKNELVLNRPELKLDRFQLKMSRNELRTKMDKAIFKDLGAEIEISDTGEILTKFKTIAEIEKVYSVLRERSEYFHRNAIDFVKHETAFTRVNQLMVRINLIAETNKNLFDAIRIIKGTASPDIVNTAQKEEKIVKLVYLRSSFLNKYISRQALFDFLTEQKSPNLQLVLHVNSSLKDLASNIESIDSEFQYYAVMLKENSRKQMESYYPRRDNTLRLAGIDSAIFTNLSSKPQVSFSGQIKSEAKTLDEIEAWSEALRTKYSDLERSNLILNGGGGVIGATNRIVQSRVKQIASVNRDILFAAAELKQKASANVRTNLIQQARAIKIIFERAALLTEYRALVRFENYTITNINTTRLNEITKLIEEIDSEMLYFGVNLKENSESELQKAFDF